MSFANKRVLVFLFTLIFLISSLTLYSDAGPKPGLRIDIRGLENQNYYTTLLSTRKMSGPHTAVDKESLVPYDLESDYDEDFDVYLKFVEYPKPEGYYFLQYFTQSNNQNRFSWNYYPPSEYKMLIYLVDEDQFIISSETYHNYAFDTYYTAVVEDNNIILISNYNATKEVLSLIGRIIFTIAIELVLAYLLNIRAKKVIYLIVGVNLITQIFLNVTLNLTSLALGKFIAVFVYLLLELIIFLIELAVYLIFFNKLSERKISWVRTTAYTLVANSASFILGLVMALIFPAMF